MPAPTNFTFLAAEWPNVYSTCAKAESLAHPDPRSACFYARRALEQFVEWLYRNDASFRSPYQDSLSARLHEPTFRNAVGATVFAKARVVKDLGNEAVHGRSAIVRDHAVAAVRELFHVAFWVARTYAKQSPPADGLTFDVALLPARAPESARTVAQLQQLEAELRERDAKLADALGARAALDEELARLRAEVAEAKRRNAERPDTHDYSEAETRRTLIDILLREAGWTLGGADDVEYEVDGMPNSATGKGRVDYVLWGTDGKPLGLVEAKRTTVDARKGQRQAELYADALERRFGVRPVIFCSNGYEHWIWDDSTYPPRPVQGFYTRAELETLHHRREHRTPLAGGKLDDAIAGRFYQQRAIRRVAETFDTDRQRKALLVMATGAGKTRTVVALSDLLMRCGWVKRVLFLADRQALVQQAVRAFRAHLPTANPVNLLEEPDAEGRVYVSTYQTMMRLIDRGGEATRKFGPGHFDLVVVDEAHRSVYRKYGAIFDWFDSLLVGLTATPRDEIDRDTYRLFDLERGVPTDVYELADAVKDRFLVPPKTISVPLRFQREGIRYDALSEEEKDDWDALEWNEDGEIPDSVDPAALNAWLMNADTVDRVLGHLMTRGLRVAGGDRIGKTIVFARNHDHAQFIVDRFDRAYPQHVGKWARVIDFQEKFAQSLIDDFSKAEHAPHIAVSVDMLDTGIDVPEVVNLVFFKLVRSKTKFWQMVGRGTRLRPDLFGPGDHKRYFYIFDYCGNVEFFAANPEADDGSSTATLGERLFTRRVDLIVALDGRASRTNHAGAISEGAAYWPSDDERRLRESVAERLRAEVEGMHVDNFVVRPHRRMVEKYGKREAWSSLGAGDVEALAASLATLPTQLPDDGEEARRFDLLMLRLQLAVLRNERSFRTLRDRVREVARALDGMSNIPMVRAELAIIQELQTDTWWQDVTAPMLEAVRVRLRTLARLIERGRRKVLYTDFEDALGEEREVDLAGLGAAASYEQFLEKARHFLRAHEDHVAIRKLRRNLPLTPTDLDELERVLAESGVGPAECVERAKGEAGGLGLFVRSLVGLDREAAKEALGTFLEQSTHTANQIEFVNLVVDHLTDHGVMPKERLWESPFTDYSEAGVDGVLPEAEVLELLATLDEVRRRAVA